MPQDRGHPWQTREGSLSPFDQGSVKSLLEPARDCQLGNSLAADADLIRCRPAQLTARSSSDQATSPSMNSCVEAVASLPSWELAGKVLGRALKAVYAWGERHG